MCLMQSKEKQSCFDFIFNFMVVTKFFNVGVSSVHLSMDGMHAMHRMGNIVKKKKMTANRIAVMLGSVLPLDGSLITAKSKKDATLNEIVIK